MRLLVVEDDTDLATALVAGLTRAGYAVDAAGTGAEALEKARLTGYDLLVLDVNLPDVDGFTVCRALAPRRDPAGPAADSAGRPPRPHPRSRRGR